MALIGSFSLYKGKYYGSIHTLTINEKIDIVPSDLSGENAPQYLVMAGTAQVGAGWVRDDREGASYISIKLDDPSLPTPIFANLVEMGDLHQLIWSRDHGQRSRAA
jgi:uncharacterized protein (DUF736 family)